MFKFVKMDPEVKARWLVGLRSGAYKQAQKRLRVGDAFCCLGVLCDILKDDPEVNGVWTSCTGEPRFIEEDVPGYCTSWPGSKTHKRAGIKVSCDILATMNDNGKTFEEIADFIEKEW
jgi:hypothetical protein